MPASIGVIKGSVFNDESGDGVLQPTETWIYTVSYTLIPADISAGSVDNQATVTGSSPGGATVSDLSDSTNLAEGDGVGTPGVGADNDDVTSTDFAAPPIVARDDTRIAPVDSTAGETGVLNVFVSNGSGADTFIGSPATPALPRWCPTPPIHRPQALR